MIMEIHGSKQTCLQWDNIILLLLIMQSLTMFMVDCRIMVYGLGHQLINSVTIGWRMETILIKVLVVAMACRFRLIREIITLTTRVLNSVLISGQASMEANQD